MPPKGGERNPRRGLPARRWGGSSAGGLPLTPGAAPPQRPSPLGSPLWAVHTERSDCGQCSQGCPGPAIPAFGSHEIKKNGGATGVCAARRAVHTEGVRAVLQRRLWVAEEPP